MAVIENLVDQLSELAIYLNELGYSISADALLSFFHLLSQTEEFDLDIEALEPYLKPLIVKTEQESEQFHEDFLSFLRKDHKDTRKEKAEQAKGRYDAEVGRILNDRERLQAQKKKKQDELDAMKKEETLPSNLKATKKKQLEQKQKKAGAEYKKLLKSLKNKPLEQNLLQLDKKAAAELTPFSRSQLEEMEAALTNLLPEAAFCKNFDAIMQYIRAELSLVRGLKKQTTPEDKRNKMKEEIQSIEQQIAFNFDEYSQRLKLFQEEVDQINREKEIFKETSIRHRTEWHMPHNAVHSLYDGDFEAMQKPFSSLTEKEKLQIRDYISENTRKFKTKISSNVRTGDRHKLDMAETCKRACATGGIPMWLCYEKPKIDKANLLLVLDVSGSCKAASELMLTFLYYLKDVFPGGCSTFAFVNRLYDISDYLDGNNVDVSVQTVLESIPRKGVYSDYNTPLQELYHTQLPKINRDTLIIFIGDARNNNNPSGEEYMKALARKSRHTYWFNTEEKEKWDTNDSIMSTYGRFCKMVGEVLNTQQLVDFLMEVK